MQGGGGWGFCLMGPEVEPGALSRIQMVAPVPPRIISLMGNHTCGPLSWMFSAAVGGDGACSSACPEDDADVHPREPG